MRRGHVLATAGVAVLTAVIVLAAALGTDLPGEAAPTPSPPTDSASAPPAASVALAEALPADARPLAGEWGSAPDGAVVTVAPEGFASPLLAVPLAGRWADVTVEGSVVDGWSVAFDVVDAGTYQAVSLRTDPARVELVRVRGGRATEPLVVPLDGPPVARAVLSLRGGVVQAEVAGVALPTASLRSGAATTTVGLLGRGDAAPPGAARWTSFTVDPVPALDPPVVPPLLQGRRVDAAEARAALSGG